MRLTVQAALIPDQVQVFWRNVGFTASKTVSKISRILVVIDVPELVVFIRSVTIFSIVITRILNSSKYWNDFKIRNCIASFVSFLEMVTSWLKNLLRLEFLSLSCADKHKTIRCLKIFKQFKLHNKRITVKTLGNLRNNFKKKGGRIVVVFSDFSWESNYSIPSKRLFLLDDLSPGSISFYIYVIFVSHATFKVETSYPKVCIFCIKL